MGLQNFINLFQDNIFYISLKKYHRFQSDDHAGGNCFAFILAAVFNQNLPGIKRYSGRFSTYRCVFPWPWPPRSGALMMNPYQGLLTHFWDILNWVAGFLTDPGQALGCIMMIAAWKTIPYWMMFMLAGMQSIPESVYEAARIDGA